MSHEHPSISQGPNPLILPEAIAKIWKDQILEMVNSKVKIRQPDSARTNSICFFVDGLKPSGCGSTALSPICIT
uniref:Uncharacterized protein n=1 Tax=Caenorhabditis japonica TaxID=281687 RepID=A0A8R1EAG4_CAEJA